jgi:ketosteroid isomerase-like protein
MRLRTQVLAWVVCVSSTVAWAAGDDLVTRVKVCEAERQRAMIAADAAALDDVFADDMIYVHSNGLEQTKSGLLGMLAKRELRYLKFDVKEATYRAYGDVVVCHGVQVISLSSSGTPFESHSRFTVVYATIGGKPRVVSYQSTLLPEIVKQETKQGE